ncbi:DNA repair protein RecO [Candidatus Wolfebacteria bacterium RIFCSPLOWO2_01_FULL_38_11]|uniref:DNA repair protein RecO n=1 Tax=Candidatus Wolfebacteria bacterium RIFCSPLOWO2_01_FULL_38_11 TaxID=1802556 RepID=A0A1F8DV91_9BACT|nr:MAG: DNA repair protein RecO [Candidatus Wolfebacteria bacterium RIFCSPLOWO2_01_FULL_38_11]
MIEFMTEYITEALVLDKEESGEMDGLITLYTEELGKVVCRAKSIKKSVSKLNGHIEPLNFVLSRLIEKGSFQMVDALTIESNIDLKDNPEILAKFLRILGFLKTMTFEFHPDLRLWAAIKKIFKERAANDYNEKLIYGAFLKIFGFDPEFASCALCHRKEAAAFVKSEHLFLCNNCTSKVPQNEIILINNA